MRSTSGRLVLVVYKDALTTTYYFVSHQQSLEWHSVGMKRIKREIERKTQSQLGLLCSAKSGFAQLVMEKFTLCFSFDRPVNHMAK